MNKPFRMYVQNGCPHCDAAIQFLSGRGLATEIIVVGFDPVAAKGIAAVVNNITLVVPILICFPTQDVIVGFQPGEYERVVRAYLESSSAVAHSPLAPTGFNLQAAPPMADGQKPVGGGTA